MATQKKVLARIRRKKRIRKKLIGTPERPRLSVFRSARHIYAQIVDDATGRTLASASSLSPDIRSSKVEGARKGVARSVGRLLAQRAVEKGISTVAMDCGGYRYHGRVQALAEAAREHGLRF